MRAPKPAIESAIEAIRDFDNTGIGILEISHRTPGWERVMKETGDLWKELLRIPDNYKVLFLGAGPAPSFTVPANLMQKKAAYLKTGTWANKAIKEAKLYGEVEIVASSDDKNYSYIPKGTPSQKTRIISISPPTIPFLALNCTRISTAPFRWSPICRPTS